MRGGEMAYPTRANFRSIPKNREKEKAEKAQTTKDCRKGCNGCGLQRFKGVCKYCG